MRPRRVAVRRAPSAIIQIIYESFLEGAQGEKATTKKSVEEKDGGIQGPRERIKAPGSINNQ
jgi:hypothetical protein